MHSTTGGEERRDGSRRGRPAARATAALILLLASAALYYFSRPAELIAVVPASWLAAAADDPGKAEEALAEATATELATRRGLRAAGWSSVVRYRARHTDMRQLAVDLGATKELIVNVRPEGTWARVTIFVVDAKSNQKLWVTDYFRKVLATSEDQRSLARRVADDFQTNQKKKARE